MEILTQLDCSMNFPGVTFLSHETVFIEDINKIKIGKGTTIEPFVKLTGEITIGKNCKVFFTFEGHNIEFGDNCELAGKIMDSKFGNLCRIGRFAEIKRSEFKDECELAGKIMDSKFGFFCKIGRFAEIKRSEFRSGVNCIHHCYIGDTKIGNGVNIGAGVITANFNGSSKNQTIIEDNAFIGTNVNLVAPIKIGHEALIATGSTVAGYDVPPNALVIDRGKKEDRFIKENYWQKIGKRWKKIKK